MFRLGFFLLFFSLLDCRFVVSLDVFQSGPSKCLIKISNFSKTNYTEETIYCDTFCCREGCCTWYITLSVYASFVIILISFGLLIVECWQFWKRKSTKNCESQELVQISPPDSDVRRNYGSGARGSQVTLHILPTAMLAHVVIQKNK